ncbi:hypothetical protein K435DRAFT_813787 [Dendrothele bispora CBS 962.96]|uniref:Uncharacterized protein n=1 Tax=Dendrothele bispora (strain CBS 962.96) TaxID=1314807 RepID=A0A4S8KLH9_DENBC|nr:hypothetical protein K435DRAFT_813787 [Dendrothele bispora CBS 962.96]
MTKSSLKSRTYLGISSKSPADVRHCSLLLKIEHASSSKARTKMGNGMRAELKKGLSERKGLGEQNRERWRRKGTSSLSSVGTSVDSEMPTTLRMTTTGIVGMMTMSGQGGIAWKVGNIDGRLEQEGLRSQEVDTSSDADSEEEPGKEDQVGDVLGSLAVLVASTTSLSELNINAATTQLIIDGEDIHVLEYAKELMELLEGTRVREGLVRTLKGAPKNGSYLRSGSTILTWRDASRPGAGTGSRVLHTTRLQLKSTFTFVYRWSPKSLDAVFVLTLNVVLGAGLGHEAVRCWRGGDPTGVEGTSNTRSSSMITPETTLAAVPTERPRVVPWGTGMGMGMVVVERKERWDHVVNPRAT